jgi:hypothetical protein
LPSKQLTNTGFPFRAYSCFGEKQEREEKGMEKIEKEKKYFSAQSSVEEIGPLLRKGVPKIYFTQYSLRENDCPL